MRMKGNLIVLLIVAFAACNEQVKTENKSKEHANESAHVVRVIPLNNGGKWKADESTKNNVASIRVLINDSAYATADKRDQLVSHLQGKIDTLISQCRMNGADHDALHVWLERVLTDTKELKQDGEYSKKYAALKDDVESFHTYFE